ncbi:MAG: hypothetical protein R2809_06570 [Flavobacteriales bacterium]
MKLVRINSFKIPNERSFGIFVSTDFTAISEQFICTREENDQACEG